MDFVHQVNLAVVLTEFIFGIYQDQSALCSHLSTAFEQCQSVFFESSVFFWSSETLSQDFFFRDIFIVQTHFGFSSRGDDRLRELFVFAHTFGQANTADFANTALVSTPCATAQVTAYNHFYRESFAHYAYSYHRVWSSQLPVGADVGSSVKELSGNLIQHLAFVRDAFGQNHVESRDAVGCYHDELFIVNVVNIAHFTVVHTLLTGKVKICFS